MSIEVYLNFNGNCREAAQFYAKVFDTELQEMMTFGQTPPSPEFPMPEEAKDLIMHTRLTIQGSNVMFSDVFPGMPFTVGNNVSLTVQSKDPEVLSSAFNQLKDGGEVQMELQETFWSKKYGSLTDKFGIVWQFNLNEEDC
ncbi:VOC family protein [Paenibacillus sp. J5C_2022]|uniref:VOC family protein n=1 Tax=Paenibacillus sp. J5C2022 TaxID=2977129 RepID=UPI0021D35E8A|nr:VOC family protein [Paenibacillus sp. J5C2022]MCU6712601.1 VOC family protein [Paenibacillus sp. J5C2022]